MKKICLINIIILFSFLRALSQQEPQFNYFYENPYLYNPAFAGKTNSTNLFLHYRLQMAGIKGAPETALLSFDGALPFQHMGLGIILQNDLNNILGRTTGRLSYAYRMTLDEKQIVHFGLSAGVEQNHIILSRVVSSQPDEMLLFQNMKPAYGFRADFGIAYSYKLLDVGLSAHNIINETLSRNEYQLKQKRLPLYLLTASYSHPINDKFDARPSVVLRSQQGMPFYFDANVTVDFMKSFSFGLTYSHQASTGVLFGYKNRNLLVGYNFNFLTNEIARASHGSHEAIISYRFRKKKEKALPSNASATDIQNYIDQRVGELVKERTQTQSQKTSIQVDSTINYKSKYKAQQEWPDTMIHVLVFQNEKDKKILESLLSGNVAKEASNQYSIASPSERLMTQDKVEFIEKGDHFVVIAAYYSLADAKKFQKLIARELKEATTLIQSKNKKFYFVSTKKVRDRDNAKSEFKRLEKKGIEKYIKGNLWIYANK